MSQKCTRVHELEAALGSFSLGFRRRFPQLKVRGGQVRSISATVTTTNKHRKGDKWICVFKFSCTFSFSWFVGAFAGRSGTVEWGNDLRRPRWIPVRLRPPTCTGAAHLPDKTVEFGGKETTKRKEECVWREVGAPLYFLGSHSKSFSISFYRKLYLRTTRYISYTINICVYPPDISALNVLRV